MNEPTSDGNQQPDPDPDPDQEQEQEQDQTSGSVFSDPTAPVWAEPTAPVPPVPPVPPAPPAPPGTEYRYGQQPAAAPQGSAPAVPPVSNPYAQQPPVQPYGQPADQYGQPQPTGQYGQPQPGQQYPAYGQQPYATGAPAPSNTSAIILTILSGVSMMFCNFLAVGSLVLGIIALSKNSTDPEGSRRLTKIGWIVLAVVWALVIVGFVLLIVLGSVSWIGDPSNFDSDI